jgi:hypothetical protein
MLLFVLAKKDMKKSMEVASHVILDARVVSAECALFALMASLGCQDAHLACQADSVLVASRVIVSVQLAMPMDV